MWRVGTSAEGSNKKGEKVYEQRKNEKSSCTYADLHFCNKCNRMRGATKFDAEAYVRGVMDANYKQKYDEYAKARGISEKDAKAEIEDTLDEQVDTELSGLEALGDFTEEEKQEYKDMLVKIDNLAKYEVKEAKEDKDGNFTVTIEVTPSDVYQTLEDNSTAVAQEMMDQGQDVSQADASMFQDLLIQSMQKSIDGNTYGDTTTIEIAVTKDSDGQYGISDSDMEKISTALFPGSV